MLLEDFKKAQLGGSVSPAGTGSVSDLNAFVNSSAFQTMNPQNPVSVEPPKGIWDEIVNTASDIGQAIANPSMTFGHMRAGLEQALGGQEQKMAEKGLEQLPITQERIKNFSRINPTTAATPEEQKAGLQDAIKTLTNQAKEGKDLYLEGKALEQGIDIELPQKSYLGTIAKGVATSTAYQLPTMAMTFLFPELAVPLTGSMFFTSSGQKYGERRNEQGADVRTSLIDADYHGLTEVATELGGAYFMGQFWKAAKQGEAVLKPFVKELISEVAGEMSATSLQNANDAARVKQLQDPNSDFSKSVSDYIFSKQHLSDQLDTVVSTLMQTGLMGVPGKIVQFDAKRRATNYTDKLNQVIKLAESNGDSHVTLPDGSDIAVDDLKDQVTEIQKEFKITIKEQEEEAVSKIDPVVETVAPVETPVAPETPSIDETQLQADVSKILEEQKAELQPKKDEVTQEEIGLEGNKVSEGVPVVKPAETPEVAPNPEFANQVVQHMTTPIQGDTLVVASPALQNYANYAEDLLIATDTKVPVSILTVDDMKANPELSDLTGKLVNYMGMPNAPVAAVHIKDGKYIVAVNPATLTKGQTLEVIIHEAVGHVLATEQYHKASPEQQAAIEKDFQAYVAKVKGGYAAKVDLQKEFYPFSFVRDIGKVETLPVGLDYVTTVEPGTNVGKEWLANQITKWATTNAKPLTLADKWFKKLADTLRKAYAKLTGNYHLPVKSVEEWLNSIFDPSRLTALDKVEEPVTAKKAISKNKQIKKLREGISQELLDRYSIGKPIDNKDPKAQTLYYKGANGALIPIKTVVGASRTAARLELEYIKSIHAASAISILDGTTPIMSKRMAHYNSLFQELKQTIGDGTDQYGQNLHQSWLEFLSNPKDFLKREDFKAIHSRSPQTERIWNGLKNLAENRPEDLRKLIVYEKKVFSKEVQEIPKVEEEVKKATEAPAIETAQEPKVKRKNIVRKQGQVNIQNSNNNLAEPGSVQALTEHLNKVEEVPAEIELDADETLSAISRLEKRIKIDKLDGSTSYGKTTLTQLERFKAHYEAIKDKKESQGLQVPDDVSDEEAMAYKDMIDGFAKAKKTKEEIKQEKLQATLYITPKKKRTVKPLTPEQKAINEAAKIERKSKREQQTRELLAKLVDMAKIAKSKGLALTEYLEQSGYSLEDNVKMMRLYLQHQGSIFSQREQILRIAESLGLYNSIDGTSGIDDIVKARFPAIPAAATDTLSLLGIRGRDVILQILQDMHFKTFGKEFDQQGYQTLHDWKVAKEKEHETASFWKKSQMFLNRFIDRNQDLLSTTPSGSQLVWHLKQILSAQYSLYSRDYMTHIDEMLKEFPDVEKRIELGAMYRRGETGNTASEKKYIALMRQLFTTYGMEMERLGFKIFYNSKKQELFKFDPAEYYWPHMWEKGAFDSPNEKMINSLLLGRKAINEAEARKIIHKFSRRYQMLQTPRFANMEMARETDLGGWIEDPVEVMRRYVANGSRRMAVVRVMGPSAEARLLSMARNHLQEGVDPKAMEDAVSVINAVVGGYVNVDNDPVARWGADGLQAMAVITMLQHSVLYQPGVASNVVGKVGWKHLIKGFSQILTANKETREVNKARGYALGVAERFISREIFDNLNQNELGTARATAVLRKWGVLGLDQWMRAGTALAATTYLQEEIAKYMAGSKTAEKALRLAYIDPVMIKDAVDNNREEEVQDWIRMGAFTLTQQTNFATDALTSPAWLKGNSPWKNLITLFSRFSYHQHKLFADMLRNNPTRLFSQLPAQMMFGAPIYILRLLAKGVDPLKELEKDSVLFTLYKMLMSGSGLGLFTEAVINAISGNSGQAGGPLAGTLAQVTGAVGGAAKAVANGDEIKEDSYVQAIRGLITAGIYVTARYAPAQIGIPTAAGLAFVAPAIEKNFIPTSKDSETNFSGR